MILPVAKDMTSLEGIDCTPVISSSDPIMNSLYVFRHMGGCRKRSASYIRRAEDGKSAYELERTM
jgi:hypothetical protein